MHVLLIGRFLPRVDLDEGAGVRRLLIARQLLRMALAARLRPHERLSRGDRGRVRPVFGNRTRLFPRRRRTHRSLRTGAQGLAVALSVLGTLDVARRESTGIPLWTQPADVFSPRYVAAPRCERANRVHVRDMPAATALGEILTRLAPPEGPRIWVYTGQGGMILFDALRPLRGRVGVVDRSGLLDRFLTASETAVAQGRSRYGLNIEFDTLLDRQRLQRAQ